MEQFILNSFKDDINSVHWTCFENNPIKEVYDRRFSKYNPQIESVYDNNYKKNITTTVVRFNLRPPKK
jgi:hypothetical protein